MSSDGYLAPPDQKPANAELWIQTWNMLDRFLPDLFAELFPEEAKKPRAPRKPAGTAAVDANSLASRPDTTPPLLPPLLPLLLQSLLTQTQHNNLLILLMNPLHRRPHRLLPLLRISLWTRQNPLPKGWLTRRTCNLNVHPLSDTLSLYTTC